MNSIPKLLPTGLLALFCLVWSIQASGQASNIVGETVPDFSLYDQDGNLFTLSDQAGKVVVIHICAGWCPPCRELAANYFLVEQELDSSLGAENYVLLDLLLEDGAFLPSTETFAKTWKTTFNTPNRVLHLGGVAWPSTEARGLVELWFNHDNQASIPTNLVVDATGKIAGSIVGFDVTAENAAVEFAAAIEEAVLSGPLPIDIDIKPKSDPNAVNPDAGGFLPVAILSDDQFDALDVDPETILFGPSEIAPARTPRAADVDDDGDLDLIAHFVLSDSGLACGEISATLIALTFSGDVVEGVDSIVTRCR